MKTSLTLFSPAKINICLFVLKKRNDNFHEIASIMQAVSFGDILSFTKGSQDGLTSSDSSLRCDKSNLITQAVNLFREKTKVLFPIKIHLEKKIPKEAGLGGGSSNIATTLWALNQFLKEPRSIETLKHWAGLISSDAPFFFSSGTAYATGRGEKIQDIQPSMNLSSLWIANPSFKLKTPEVYRNFNPENFNAIKDPYQIIEKIRKNPSEAINDLENAAFSIKPKLKEIKTDLFKLGFKHVLMTGSGTAFYCLGPITDPVLKNITFYPISCLSRASDNWYCT